MKKMAATDGQIVLAASRFGDATPVYLRDFAKTELPAIAKIVKGQHHNLGVPTLSNPSLQSTALFLNAGRKYQILAQPIKIKEGRKASNVGPKVLIPETYTGFFELLSEDGRSTRCIDSVLELSRKHNLRVLVRETFRCSHLTKTIHAGEILTTLYENGKYLKCKTSKDEVISLPLEGKAKFSPIAKEDSISGVHTVKNLLKKRMPVVVRLVHGLAPKGLKQPFVPELRLIGCVEVDRVYALTLQKDSDLVAVPLNAKIKLQRAKNMDQLENFIEYTRFYEKAQRLLTEARDRLQIVDLKLSEKEKSDTKHSSSRKAPSGTSGGHENGYILRKSASYSCQESKYIQSTEIGPIADEYDEIDQIYDYVRGFAPLPKSASKLESIIDAQQNSHHVTKTSDTSRSQHDSGNYSSLVKSNNNNSSESIKHSTHSHHQYLYNQNHSSHHQPQQQQHQPQQQQQQHHHHSSHEDAKPVPPPIETIPSKKVPEKRHRPTLPKLYVKNTNNNHHQKTSPIVQAPPPIGGIAPKSSKESLEPQSPLFHIRYKSLSSLQLTPDTNANNPAPLSTPKGQDKNHHLTKSASAHCTREGTLDSSRSGGRTSADSKLPEKKTRRLSRPRSLSNLVWDLRPQKDKSKKKFYVHQFDCRQQGTLYL